MNKKDADLTAQMRRLICVFVVHIHVYGINRFCHDAAHFIKWSTGKSLVWFYTTCPDSSVQIFRIITFNNPYFWFLPNYTCMPLTLRIKISSVEFEKEMFCEK